MIIYLNFGTEIQFFKYCNIYKNIKTFFLKAPDNFFKRPGFEFRQNSHHSMIATIITTSKLPQQTENIAKKKTRIENLTNTPTIHPPSTATSGRMRTAEARGGEARRGSDKRGGEQHTAGGAGANVRVGTKGKSAETRRAGDARRPFSRARVRSRPTSPFARPPRPPRDACVRPRGVLPPLGWYVCGVGRMRVGCMAADFPLHLSGYRSVSV